MTDITPAPIQLRTVAFYAADGALLKTCQGSPATVMANVERAPEETARIRDLTHTPWEYMPFSVLAEEGEPTAAPLLVVD